MAAELLPLFAKDRNERSTKVQIVYGSFLWRLVHIISQVGEEKILNEGATLDIEHGGNVYQVNIDPLRIIGKPKVVS